MTAAAQETEAPVPLSQELLAAFPLPPTHIHLSPSLSPLPTQYEPYYSPRVSRRPHTDSRLPLPEESPTPLPQLASSRTALPVACLPAAEPSGVPPVGCTAVPQETEQLAPQSQIRLPHESPLPPPPPPPPPLPPPMPPPRSRATSSHVEVLGSRAAGAVAEVVAIKVTAETGADADASTTPPRRQRVAISASGDMEAAGESVSRQVDPGRESPILVTFHQAGLTSIDPAPLPIGVVYAYNTDIAAGRTRSPSQLSASCDARSGAAAQRGLSYHEDVQRANGCGSDEATRVGDSGGSAAVGIRRSGSRIAWLSPRRRSQRARAEREEREVEQALGEDDKPGAGLEQESFGGEDLEWIRDRNGAQVGGPTRALPMAPPPTSRLPRMLVKALSGARRGAARRDAGAAPATAAPAAAPPTAAPPATLASASPGRSLVDGSAAFGCGCAVSSCSSLPHRAAPHSGGQSRRSRRTSEESDLTASESADPHPRRALSGPGINGDSAP